MDAFLIALAIVGVVLLTGGFVVVLRLRNRGALVETNWPLLSAVMAASAGASILVTAVLRLISTE